MKNFYKLFRVSIRIRTTIILFFIGIESISYSQTINTIAGNGVAGYSGDGGPAILAELSGPNALVIDHTGNIYLADQQNARIRLINTAGIISTFAGNGTVGYSGDGGSATAAEFNQPTFTTFDSLQNIYVVDCNNQRVRKITTSGIITTDAGNGIQGYSGNGGAATSAELFLPSCVIADDTGNLYIVDTWNNVIRKVNTSGIIELFAGNNIEGYSGDGGNAKLAELNLPFRIVFDKQWNMYIADGFNNRIREVNTSGIITTIAGNGIVGYSGDGGPATSAEINEPYGVCIDASGNIYIADTYNNRVREVNTSGIISTYAGTGTASYSGDGGPATAAEINWPTEVSLDDYSNLYINDYKNNRVRKVTAPLVISIVAIDNVNCNVGSYGSATATASGGTSPYTYLWAPSGGSNATAGGLSAGGYTVTVTDNTGSTASATTTIIQSAGGLAVTTRVIADVSCNDGNNGIILSSVSGGSEPYTYVWSGSYSNVGTNALADELTAGTYTVYILDNTGCSGSATAVLTQPPAIIIKIDSIHVMLSSSDCNGEVAISEISGGVPPYVYLWTGELTTDTIFNLCKGTYCCLVTDSSGCVDSVCVDITTSTGINNPDSYRDGQLTVYPNPNNGIFTIQWSGISRQSQRDPFGWSVEIYNVLGQEVYKTSPLTPLLGQGEGNKEINLSSQPNGVYLYRVLTQTGNLIGEGKVVIEK